MERGTVLIIIPAYNEEKNLPLVIKKIKDIFPQGDILVVNDGSEDGTCRVAREAGAQLLELPFNMGYGAALQTGYIYALMNNYECAIQLDADGQHDPSYLPCLLEELDRSGADVVIGSRYLAPGGYSPPLFRRLGSMVFARLISFLIGQNITDPTSGYRALNKRAIRFYASKFYPLDYPDADVILMLHRFGLKVKEVMVEMYPSPPKKSMHAGWGPLYYTFKMFLSIFLTLLRREGFPEEVGS